MKCLLFGGFLHFQHSYRHFIFVYPANRRAGKRYIIQRNSCRLYTTRKHIAYSTQVTRQNIYDEIFAYIRECACVSRALRPHAKSSMKGNCLERTRNKVRESSMCRHRSINTRRCSTFRHIQIERRTQKLKVKKFQVKLI